MSLKLFALLAFGLAATAAGFFSEKKLPAAPAAAAIKTHPDHVVGTKLETGNPEELGSVHWLRDLAEGTAQAQKSGKPLLVLFQEVPGCSNCTRFGNGPLRHPLVVEAIEAYFVPVCIFNNKGGADAAALKKFEEPSWNNPVVRIVRATDLADVVPRMANFSNPTELLAGIRQAVDQPLPWLQLVENEYAARLAGTETATFAMHCFWEGEGAFGNVAGVVETEPGFQDGHEVVRVVFDPRAVSRADLEAKTQAAGTQSCSKNEGFRADREPKYYLSRTPWRFVPMTSGQALRANSLVGKGQSPEAVLSPRQLELGKFIEANPGRKWVSAIGAKDLAKAWAEVQQLVQGG